MLDALSIVIGAKNVQKTTINSIIKGSGVDLLKISMKRKHLTPMLFLYIQTPRTKCQCQNVYLENDSIAVSWLILLWNRMVRDCDTVNGWLLLAIMWGWCRRLNRVPAWTKERVCGTEFFWKAYSNCVIVCRGPTKRFRVNWVVRKRDRRSERLAK